MELSIYQIILGPVVSDKAYRLSKTQQKIVLDVHPEANKPLVKEAVERLMNVQVESVAIIVRKGKNRTTRRRTITTGKTKKRAIVTLKDGFSVNLFGDIANQAAHQTTPLKA